MRKKSLIFFVLAIATLGLISSYLAISFTSSLDLNAPCAFCDSKIIDRQKFYEDDLVIALCTHKPIVPSHFLVIPKRHVTHLDMLSMDEMARIHQVLGRVNRASQEVFQTLPYFVHQKNGREVGQSVPHVHFHLIAKPAGDDSFLKFFMKLIFAHLKGPIGPKELQSVIEKMAVSMQSGAP